MELVTVGILGAVFLFMIGYTAKKLLTKRSVQSYTYETVTNEYGEQIETVKENN